jgi:DNA-binding HxlR family transcriptional regulator
VGTAPTLQAQDAVPNGSSATPAAAAAGVCPYFHEAVELLGKRWTGVIVLSLLGGPMRFSAITHAIPQISDRLLSIRLKELEACEIVTRKVSEDAPIRVEYELTSKGRALEPTVTSLRAWACDWLRDQA